jgi:signal transduction histidine kinase
VRAYLAKAPGKLALLLFAVLIGLSSLLYTRNLVRKLKAEERENVSLWAEAIRLVNSADSTHNLEFLSTVIEMNNTVPVVLADESDRIIASRNFDSRRKKDPRYIEKNLDRIRHENEPIRIDLPDYHYNMVYYEDSIILTALTYYPYIQLGIIVLFILVSYLAFQSSRKAGQNQLWVGMSKETAHQLGTPASSLSAWVEILQEKYPEIPITKELALDVERLEKVTRRFSRIGAKPSLKKENIVHLIIKTIDYLRSRSSSKIDFITEFDREKEVLIPVDSALFEWVIENVSKNAIDAMEGMGKITYRIFESEKNVVIEISDTGKGIPKRAFKKIFTPGYTTKQRGWGLGLSLSKRIIEEYHKGKILVGYSEPGKGSSLQIIMKK